MFRRFFVYDTISGIDASDGYRAKTPAKVVRFASDVKLNIELDPENEENQSENFSDRSESEEEFDDPHILKKKNLLRRLSDFLYLISGQLYRVPIQFYVSK